MKLDIVSVPDTRASFKSSNPLVMSSFTIPTKSLAALKNGLFANSANLLERSTSSLKDFSLFCSSKILASLSKVPAVLFNSIFFRVSW